MKVRSLKIDGIDVAVLPAWIVPIFCRLRESFRGQVEDKILTDWLSLECQQSALSVRCVTVDAYKWCAHRRTNRNPTRLCWQKGVRL